MSRAKIEKGLELVRSMDTSKTVSNLLRNYMVNVLQYREVEVLMFDTYFSISFKTKTGEKLHMVDVDIRTYQIREYI